MKKTRIILICLLLLICFSVYGYADTYVYEQPSSYSVSPGCDVDIYLSVNSDSVQKAFSVAVDYDDEYFEYKGFEWIGSLQGFGTFDPGAKEGVVILDSAVAASGSIFKLTLTVKDGAALNTDTTVTMKFKAGSTGSWVSGSETVDIVCSHSYTDWIVLSYPGCTYEGSQYRECYYCHDIQYSSIPATGHYFSDWEIETAPTCTEDGYGCCTCYYCGYSEGSSIPALGHIVNDGTIIKEATCTEHGVLKGTCERCGETSTVETDFAEHNYGEWTIIKESTCTETGLREHICDDCGHKESEVSLPLGHDYSGGQEITKATIYSSGLFEAHCKRCGNEGSVITPPSWTDKTTNLYFETTEGVFEKGTVLNVVMSVLEYKTQTEEGEPEYKAIKEVVYNITASLDGKSVQPAGTVSVTIPLLDGWGTNIAVYYEDGKGKRTELPVIIDTNKKTVTIEINHFSNYVIENKDVEKKESDDPKPSFGFPAWGHYVIEGLLAFTLIIVFFTRNNKDKVNGKNQVEEEIKIETVDNEEVIEETTDNLQPIPVHHIEPVTYDDMQESENEPFIELDIPKPKSILDHDEMTKALDSLWEDNKDEDK